VNQESPLIIILLHGLVCPCIYSCPPPAKHTYHALTTQPNQWAVLVFRSTSLDDKGHVEFSRLFGELDDVKPYLAAGRKNRFAYDEIFDVSNQEDDGRIVAVDSKRDHLSRVCLPAYLPAYSFVLPSAGRCSSGVSEDH
jgi:hypothetical protein